jgi:hypothetical protein
MYLRMLGVKKIGPTARRMNKMLGGPCPGLKTNRRSELISDYSSLSGI